MEESKMSIPRSLDTPIGRLYAEWKLLLFDLERCLEVAELWRTQFHDGELKFDKVISASLFRDAVVRFTACFDAAASVRLDADDLYGPPHTEGGVEYFKWLSSLRDTWIAHRHGASRQAHTVVAVDEDTGDVLGIGVHISAMASYEPGEDEGFIALIRLAISYAEKRANELRRVVSNEIASMHGTQRMRLPIAAAKVPNGRTLHMGRRKYGNINRYARNHFSTDIPE